MTIQEQRDRVKAMLTRYRDALHQGPQGLTYAEAHDSRLLLFGPDYNQALRELDRCLTQMRKHGNQQAINGIPLKTIRWHLIAYYIDVDYVQAPVMVQTMTKKGWKWEQRGYELVLRRHKDAQPRHKLLEDEFGFERGTLVNRKAELGVTWIANEYDWDHTHLQAICEACGEAHPIGCECEGCQKKRVKVAA